MVTQVKTGSVVAPGDALYVEPFDPTNEDRVTAGLGCYVRLVAPADEASNTAERQVIASRLGVAQWEGSTVHVYPRAAARSAAAQQGGGALRTAVEQQSATATAAVVDKTVAAAAGSSSNSLIFGPRPGDRVHLRVTRVARLFAFGEVIAINGVWSSISSSAALGRSEAFRGIVRMEDIRPFRPSKEQLLPPAPALAYKPGDVVLAEVISQSDVRQYQLSTVGDSLGVVESTAVCDGVRHRLQPIPGRRDAMVNPKDGSVHSRWCPLISI